ncbi:g-protein coupled receptor [Holotrichia oblita]|uniref:G-protein coupled receptor n=1 Tax=Holotrichia oblita TaxID=644536 RepID=A0ACB9TAB2_HOLOL|nr:g-protein coupled receptor [Holotrichia oblita]
MPLTSRSDEGHKCREEWPSESSERAYNLFLDAMLLLIPLVFMSLAYSLIMSKLWKGLRREIQHNTSCQQQMLDRSSSSLNVNGLLVRNNNTSTTTVNSLASMRQNRLLPSIARLHDDKRKKVAQKGKNKKETVKMWLMKGIVQVRSDCIVPSASQPSVIAFALIILY